MPCWSKPVVPTVSCSPRKPVTARWGARLTKAPRHEWSSTDRPAALAVLRMAALARQRPTTALASIEA
eukprot:9622500-Alexandrium_andersonii.AAC.1